MTIAVEAIDRLFQRLAATYGAAWDRSLGQAPIADVKTAWAHEMQAALGGDRPNYDELLRPQTDAARQRVEMLRTRYKLDPAFMKAADDLYGPLEWRLPETHSIYWATVGLAKVKNKELLALRRAVYQSLHLAVLRGRIVLLPTNGFVSRWRAGLIRILEKSENGLFSAFVGLMPPRLGV